MTLRHIEIFAMVCREGSVTKAAERLHVSQPTVSLALKEIEEHYGGALFERISRKLYLTPFGQRIYDMSLSLLNLYSDVSDAHQIYDIIRIGTGTAIGKFFMPKIIRGFSEIHPDVHINANVGDATRMYRLIMKNSLDFTIAETVDDILGLAHKTIQRYPIVAVCHKDNPLARKEMVKAKDLEDQRLLLRESGSTTRNTVDTFSQTHNIPMDIVWVSHSVQSLFNATSENLGISFHSLDLAVACKDPNLVILNIPELKGERLVNVSFHRDKIISHNMQIFLDYYQETTQKMLVENIDSYLSRYPDANFVRKYIL